MTDAEGAVRIFKAAWFAEATRKAHIEKDELRSFRKPGDD